MTLQEKTENSSVKLWERLYLTSVGLYGTVGGMFLVIYALQTYLRFGYLLASFVTFFIVVFLRGIFDSVLILEAPLSQKRLGRLSLLSLETTLVLCPILYLLKAPFGEWSVVIAIGISSKVVNWLKDKTFPPSQHKDVDFFAQLFAKKLPLYSKCLYGFFIGLGILTYAGVSIWGMENFSPIFSFVLFFTLLANMTAEWTFVYERPLRRAEFMGFCGGAAIGALITTVLVILMVNELGWQGKAATICAVIILKLVQPWLTNRFLQSKQAIP